METVTTVSHVSVFDGYRMLEGTRDVRIEDGRITAVSPATAPTTGPDVVDGTGKVLIPGLIDAHVHLTQAAELEQLADHGVTTGLDMSIWSVETLKALRAAAGRPTEHGVAADLRAAGLSLAGKQSTHSRIPGYPKDGLVETPEEIVAAVRARHDEGVDYIKLVFAEPGIPADAARAGVEEAHRLGLKVVAHAASVESYRLAVEVGVDVVTHVPMDGLLDAAILDGLTRRRQVVVPTLSMMQGIARNHGADFSGAQDAVRVLHDAQVLLLAGTDANAAPGVPASVEHGTSLHEELELMQACGVPAIQALTSATASTAAFFGLEDRGRVAEGLRADLVLLDGNPLEDLSATRRIAGVWVAGNPVPADRLGTDGAAA